MGYLDNAGLARLTARLKEALAGKQDAISGQAGQVVGFDSAGQPVAQAAPSGGVTSFKGRTGAVAPASGDYTAAQVGAAPASRTVNGKALTSNITLSAADVGALASGGTAAAAAKLAAARTIDGVSFDGTAAVKHYGTCSTAAATADKVVSLAGFSLAAGARVTVKFTYENDASNPTLNVNATGAKPIMIDADHAGRGGIWGNGRAVEFVYDGACWVLVSPSFAEGNAIATGHSSHAEGNGYSGKILTTASGTAAHAEGNSTLAAGVCAHSEGRETQAQGNYSHAEGRDTHADAIGSHTEGLGTRASQSYSHAGGQYNNDMNSGDLFVLGWGTSTAKKNVFRVTTAGKVYGLSAFGSTGADYAEYFEWLDGNPENQDRVGLFVTLDGEKIRLAQPGDEFVLGIVSGNPSVIGDAFEDQWAGQYETDIFGRPVNEERTIPAELDKDGNVIIPERTEIHQKLSPNYDGAEAYIPRSQRPEWAVVGMMGKLVVADDGACEVNGWCAPGQDGVAARSETRTRYRVMSRVDGNHIRVLIL